MIRAARTLGATLVCAGAAAIPLTAPVVGPATPASATPVVLAARHQPPPASAYLLVDLRTGVVFDSYFPHLLLRPASLTKMLTALIAVNWLPPYAGVPVTKTAASVYPDKVGMVPGTTWSMTTTLHALLIVSANDAAYALAQRVSGSIPRFGPVMQTAAAELGMNDGPVFRDPAGLDAQGYDGGNLMSAWDVAIAARDLLANPTLRPIVGTRVYWFTDPSHIVNELVNFNEAFLDSYAGAIGVKTGYTDAAGMCVAEAAVRGDRELLAVVMNGSNPDATAATLLNEGFRTPAAAERGPRLPPIRQPYPPPLPRSKVPVAAVKPLAQKASSSGAASFGGTGEVVLVAAVAVFAAGMALIIRVTHRRRRQLRFRRSRIGRHGRYRY